MPSADQVVGKLSFFSGRDQERTNLEVGAIVSLSPPSEGDIIWEAKQVKIAHFLPPGNIEGRQEIDWSFDPIKLGVSISIVGINVGNIFGNLKDGVGLNVNLFAAKGEIKLYLKNESDLWVHIDVSVTFDGSFEGDYKILSF
ncbi:hypothetical protein FACUT_13636 [Fusarium acutatum]|uniref:Uncharacterized protein n=1 Tax=Fusarium acutatum TaxID=78861 RepID=A0A8H4J8H9_9HYPO|nr:hypothetical protein FACUT_13636 [Fusarium acutatum]